MKSFHKEEFYGELYPSTLAMIIGYRDTFEMLRDAAKEERTLDIIGDVLIRVVE
ncbi:hypothetical protein V8C42DRAFT_303549 [Trichoderma barbatum]